MSRCIATLIGALILTAALSAQSGETSPADAVLAKLDAYLAAYEPRLSELIADEDMRQEMRRPGAYRPSDGYNGTPMTSTKRQISAEVAFIGLPGDSGWLGFRHVKAVDAKPVELSTASLLSSLKVQGYSEARALLEESAQHNLGLPRTTNLPNLPLEFLHVRNRKRLLARPDGQEAIRGVRTSRVVLLERMTPTLIRNPKTNSDMPAVIRAWIDPRDGRLLRAEVSTFNSLAAKSPENFLRVDFTEDKALSLLVPSEMREQFPVEKPGTGTSIARYSNFRKFQTSARIVPQ